MSTKNKLAAAPKAEKVSRTDLATLITKSGKNYFISTHIDKEKKKCTMKCRLAAGANNQLGNIRVYVPKLKDYRTINTRTLTNLEIGGRLLAAK